MNSDFFAIFTTGLETKAVFEEMVDPSLYSSLDNDSPSGQLMYDSLADFCLQSSGNMQKLNNNSSSVFQQTTQQHLQNQFSQHMNMPANSYDNLISPTIEELTFEDCCSEMLKLLDENDINSLEDINTTLQNEIENNKVNFQALAVPINVNNNSNINIVNNNVSTEYILNNFYDFDECNNLQENLLLDNNLTLAQLNSPEFALASFDGSQLESGQSLRVMPIEIVGGRGNMQSLNTIIIEPKLASPSLSNATMKQEPELYICSSRGLNALASESGRIIFKGETYDAMQNHYNKNEVVLGSTLSHDQLKTIFKGAETSRGFEMKSEPLGDDNFANKPPKPEGSESILEAYLLGAPKEPPKPHPQTMDTYEDLGALWDICDEEEAVSSVSCEKNVAERPITRKARKHLDSETSVENMSGDESDEQYQISDDEYEAAEFLMDLKNKDEGQRFFWQYNVLSKGPKGRRLCKSIDNPDPHILGDFQDPVFHQEQDKYKHNGKARRGDGNDITPNPYKLYATGIELQKLNKQINMMAPGNDWPSSQKNKTLKERNKLASRACRLKKKAQHEANKLKLHGLKLEHSQVMKVIRVVREMLMKKAREEIPLDASMIQQFNAILKKHHALFVGGRTADYVNSILAKVASGDKTGGINLKS